MLLPATLTWCTCLPLLIHMCAMTHWYVCHDSLICVPWLIDMCAMTHSYVCHDLFIYVPGLVVTFQNIFTTRMIPMYVWVWGMGTPQLQSGLDVRYVDSFICVPRLIHMCAMIHSYVCHDSLICVPWLIHMCALTHSYVCHFLFICVPWLIDMCAMTHWYVCHDSFICVPWLIHMCAMTRSYVCHDSFICVPWLVHMCAMTHSCVPRFCVQYVDSCVCVPGLIHTCAMTHSYVCKTNNFFEMMISSFVPVSYGIWVPAESINLQIFFHKTLNFRGAIMTVAWHEKFCFLEKSTESKKFRFLGIFRYKYKLKFGQNWVCAAELELSDVVDFEGISSLNGICDILF